MKKGLIAFASGAAAIMACANSPFISEVYEFRPAPGQFIHSVPAITDDMSEKDVLDAVARQLVGDERPGMVSLGAFGGYVVFGFDHPVINVRGDYDLKIFGNAFKADGSSTNGGSCEPGIVMVSRDTNGNGKPDDEWFELRGSAYDDPGTVKNFTITYNHPSQTEKAEDISWTSNCADDASGKVEANTFHQQSYWPGWLGDNETLTFTGTRLPKNAVDQSGDGSYWVLNFFEWGYVDNLPDFVSDPEKGLVPNPENPGFNLDNAVDYEGNHVELASVDFIKVYTAVNQTCGWIGETSTEVCGARDLHPDAKPSAGLDAITTDMPQIRLSGSTLTADVNSDGLLTIYSMSGAALLNAEINAGHNTVDLSGLARGIYIVSHNGKSVSIALR